MPVHRDLTGTQVHTPITWEYDDQIAREATTGFETSDLGKFAWQKDDNSIWVLIAVTPTWVSVSGSASVVNNSITDGNTDTAPSEDAVHDALAGKADLFCPYSAIHAGVVHQCGHNIFPGVHLYPSKTIWT